MRLAGIEKSSGFTIMEMVVVLALIGVLSGLAVMNLRALSSPAENGAAQLLGFLKQARARAISSTSAYFVVPVSSTEVATRAGVSCSDPSPVPDSSLNLDLPNGASLTSTGWSICFTSRGLSDSNFEITVSDTQSGSRSIEVLLGGGVRYRGV